MNKIKLKKFWCYLWIVLGINAILTILPKLYYNADLDDKFLRFGLGFFVTLGIIEWMRLYVDDLKKLNKLNGKLDKNKENKKKD